MMIAPKGELPLIVDVKRDSQEDGPGSRSVVFFKGCPLRCIFCQNPETQSPEAEIAFSGRACIGCGRCGEACPRGAVDLEFPERIHREKCVRCGKCAQVCPGEGLRVIGAYSPPESLAELLFRDLPFYTHSGGGVTLSGGECTLYPDYLEALLKLLKARHVHVVLETSGCFDYGLFERKILPYLDFVYFDLKLADGQAHKKHLGAANGKILENFRLLLKQGQVEVHPRIPLIPGITTTRDNLSSIVEFLRGTGAENVSLLPYNPMGMEMYPKLGRPKPPLLERFMKPDEEKGIYDLFESILKKKRSVRGLAPEAGDRLSSPPSRESWSPAG